MADTFTVYSPSDSSMIYGEGLTARDAAQEILSYDGARHEMRREGAFWTLFVNSASDQMVPAWANDKPLHAMVETEDEAWAEIALKVLYHGWGGTHPEAMTDAAFAAEAAQFAEDDA